MLAEAPASDLVVDVGAGTGIFARQLRAALRDLATPHQVDEEHVLFGYVFQCFTARRDA
jgi:hypothetical protein